MNLKELLSGLKVINDKLIEEGQNPEDYHVIVTGLYGSVTDDLRIELGRNNFINKENCLIINTDLSTG